MATKQLEKIFSSKKFDYPKPYELIYFLIKLYTNKDAIILDFFAGSGTTGHAVLELNREDSGNRKFILCTNNENDICKEVTFPRMQKIIHGYKFKGNDKTTLFQKKLTFSQLKNIDETIHEINEAIEKNQPKYNKIEKKIEDNTISLVGVKNINDKKEGLGGNLKYFKTDFVDYKESTDRNKIKLTKEAVEMLCVKEGTFESVLNNEDFKIFKNQNRYAGIIFDQLAIKDFKKAIKDIKGKISVYIFSLGDDSFEDEFEDVKRKVKLSPIPEAILKVYRRIYK